MSELFESSVLASLRNFVKKMSSYQISLFMQMYHNLAISDRFGGYFWAEWGFKC